MKENARGRRGMVPGAHPNRAGGGGRAQTLKRADRLVDTDIATDTGAEDRPLPADQRRARTGGAHRRGAVAVSSGLSAESRGGEAMELGPMKTTRPRRPARVQAKTRGRTVAKRRTVATGAGRKR